MDLNFSKDAVFCNTGFMIKNHNIGAHARLFVFSNLNPEVKIPYVFTRWELFRLSIWFLRQAVRS